MKEQERKCTLPEAKRRENLKVSIVKFYREPQNLDRAPKHWRGAKMEVRPLIRRLTVRLQYSEQHGITARTKSQTGGTKPHAWKHTHTNMVDCGSCASKEAEHS